MKNNSLPIQSNFQSENGLTSKSDFQKKIKGVVSFAKYSYLMLVLVLLLCAVVELKHIFNIDIFPGIDTPIDNAYYAGAEQLGIHTL